MPYNVRVYDYPLGRQIRIYDYDISTHAESMEALKELEYRLMCENMINPFTDAKITMSYEEFSENWYQEPEKKKREKKEACTDKKKADNANRAKNRIFELARANEWEWFITMTFDRNGFNASDYKACCKKITKFFENMRQRYAPDLKYLLLPELHKDGINFHFHGLLADCGSMIFADSGIIKDGKPVYNMSNYTGGFSMATQIEDTRRVSTYITKYVTKQLNVVLSGCNRYLRSRNLDEPIITDYQMTDDQIMDMIISLSDDIVYMKQTKSDFCGKVRYLEVTK